MPEQIDAFYTIDDERLLTSAKVKDTKNLSAAARDLRAYKALRKRLVKHIRLMREFVKHAEDWCLIDECEATAANLRNCQCAVKEGQRALQRHNRLGPMLVARFHDREHTRQAEARAAERKTT